MRNSKSVRTIAVSGAALLALAACGGGGDEGGDTRRTAPAAKRSRSTSTAPTATWVTPLGEQFQDEGALEGMKGTTPLTELAADFTRPAARGGPGARQHLQLRR